MKQLFVAIVLNMLCYYSYSEENILWYNKPACNEGKASWLIENPSYKHKINPDRAWEEYALPIGNGSIGAMIFGSIEEDRIQFNEKTVWEGGPHVDGYYSANRNDAWKKLPQIRQLVIEGKGEEAEELSKKYLTGTYIKKNLDNPYFGKYQTFGELYFSTGINQEEVRNYRRFLELNRAIAGVDFEYKGVAYSRKYFISYPDQVMVLKFSADKPGCQNIKFSMDSPHQNTQKGQNNELEFIGSLKNNKMMIVARIKAIVKGGDCVFANGKMNISKADEVVFLISSDTEYKLSHPTYDGEKPLEVTRKVINKAQKKTYAELLAAHTSDFGKLYNRVQLNLNGEKKDEPTNIRISNYIENQNDKGLEELYYNFGRYLLISSSRPGNLPANLQGIWCNEIVPAWQCDYHLNINVQMNYWNAEPANLSECHLPLIDLIKNLSIAGATTAQEYFNARGWCSNIATNAYGYTAPGNAPYMFWAYFPLSGAWLVQHVWDHYEFTLDKKYLKDIAYPILKGQALFICDYLTKDPSDGTLISMPSWSPEHGSVSTGATIDHQMAREALRFTIEAANILNIDTELKKEWQQVYNNISPNRIGQYGQLQEWKEDWDDPKDQHRHIAHLFGLHPGTEIHPITTPKLAAAAKKSLEFRGDKSTGWSIGWKMNFWARLLNGNRAYKLLQNMLVYRTSNNLFSLHPPFMIDGNFGATAGITEMLLQSHTGTIHLLPALPENWSSGQVTGLKARGNFRIAMKWEKGELVTAKIESLKGGNCIIRYSDKELRMKLKQGEQIILNQKLEKQNI